MKLRMVCAVVGFLSLALSLVPPTVAQTPTETASALPRLVRFSGTVKDLNGTVLTGVVGITFALYSEQTGGAALWLETQNVTADSNGHYTALLGSTQPGGLPADLFTSEQARWVGVQISGQAEQPRVLLVSAPYALKAGDAETVGGLPASAFVLANPARPKTEGVAASSAATPKAQSPAPLANTTVTGKGVIDYIPMWDSASDIVDSVIFQKTSAIGINTTAPAATLDVNGKGDIRDTLTLFPKSTDSTLAISGTAFKIDQTGKMTFISGQTFPGTGTITGITTASGSGLSGGGSKGTLSLKVPAGGITNLMLQHSSLTLTAGGGMTGGGSVSLGGSTTLGLKTCAANQVLQYVSGVWTCSNAGTGTITGVTAGTDLTGGGTGGTVALNVDTTKIPQLKAANTFTGNQTVNGHLTVLNNSTYQPFLVQSSSGFGTWLELSNTSAGGRTWNILSAASGNAEGTGNLGITNLQGGTIWLEGPVHATSTLRVDGPPTGGSGMVAASFGGFGDFAIDAPGIAAGRFVVKDSTGNVGIGNAAPANQLDVYAQSKVNAINAVGFNVPSGSGVSGGGAIAAQGGTDDPASLNPLAGGPGVYAVGGADLTGKGLGGNGVEAFGGGGGSIQGGIGGSFTGGTGGVFGDGVDGIPGSGYAGNFAGDLRVSGAITAGTKDFEIDHPLDPANKYLFHSSVESSEMMNIYTGNITTDSQGLATVQLPEWFEVLNTDFRYQLTVIGQFAQAIVAHEIENNRFEIRTSAPNVKVSWQVTGVRQDAYAKANPLVVEQEKEARLRGFYIHPELYGAPPEKQIEWARHPQMMKKIQETRARQLAAAQKRATPRN
jgi:trimeric autotransporter adhesin